MKKAITIDFEELFQKLSYYDQRECIQDLLKEMLSDDKKIIISNSLEYHEMESLIDTHFGKAFDVLRRRGFLVHYEPKDYFEELKVQELSTLIKQSLGEREINELIKTLNHEKIPH